MNLCIKKSVITNVYLFILKCHMFKIGIMSVINNVYFNFLKCLHNLNFVQLLCMHTCMFLHE